MNIPSTITFRESELPLNIEAVEKKYNAKFVGDFCVKGKDGQYLDMISAVFWQETPPEGYNHYFGLSFTLQDTLIIHDATSAFESDIIGVVADNGEVVYSRRVHDYRASKDGSVAIDGGRDYIRLIGESASRPQVRIAPNGPLLEVFQI